MSHRGTLGSLLRGPLATPVLGTLTALLIAMLAGHLLILLYGATPSEVFGALVAGTWGNWYGIGQVFFKATPLVFTGLAVAIPLRAGLFNIGAEGQVVVGAFATAMVGTSLPAGTPWLLGVPLAAGAGFVAGGIWGGLAGLFKGRFGAHEVITTIMLNFIAMALINYLVVAFVAVPETLHTEAIVPGASLSRLGAFLDVFHGSAANTSIFIALAVAGVVWWLIYRTPLGYELRAMGASASAASFGGISALKVSIVSMVVGGGIAGLVGTSFVMGYKTYYEDGFSGGMGFMGIAVALLGRTHPVGVVAAALLFGTLSQGGLAINALVPKEIVDILQAVVILAVVASTAEVRALVDREGGR